MATNSLDRSQTMSQRCARDWQTADVESFDKKNVAVQKRPRLHLGDGEKARQKANRGLFLLLLHLYLATRGNESHEANHLFRERPPALILNLDDIQGPPSRPKKDIEYSDWPAKDTKRAKHGLVDVGRGRLIELTSPTRASGIIPGRAAITNGKRTYPTRTTGPFGRVFPRRGQIQIELEVGRICPLPSCSFAGWETGLQMPSIRSS